jgi:hypothetical protein
VEVTCHFLDLDSYKDKVNARVSDVIEIAPGAPCTWLVANRPLLLTECPWDQQLGQAVIVPLIPYRTAAGFGHLLAFSMELAARAVLALPNGSRPGRLHLSVGVPAEAIGDQQRLLIGMAVRLL